MSYMRKYINFSFIREAQWQAYFFFIATMSGFFSCNTSSLFFFNTSAQCARVGIVSGWVALKRQYALNTCRLYLLSRQVQPGDVIIYDIHDTLLDVSIPLLFLYKNFSIKNAQLVMDISVMPIVAVQEFYYQMSACGYTPIILTAGLESKRALYNSLLHIAGYDGYALFCMEQLEKQYMTKAKNKEMTRIMLSLCGYNIKATVGDQWGDIIGLVTGMPCKLPNVIYTAL
jgi:hypothetical protein